MRKPTVFISYSHADSDFVDQLADRLKASDVDVWIDKWMIKVGDSITGKVNEGIGASDFLVAVLSQASVNSRWVREELNTATIRNIEQEKRAFILPILIEKCELPSLLQHRKYADFTKDPERAFQELLEVIRPQPARLFFEPEMVLIPAGEFLMGSDPEKDKYARKDEQPQHKLYLPDYYMAKTPITNVQYLRWINKNPPTGKENHPVVFVVWRDAMVYCRWLSEVTGKSYHLPSEAEWEKAARGTDGRIWPWGNVPPDATQCNYNMTVDNTTPIGQYPKGASPYGVLDMAGNVWEWTSSLYKEYPYKAADGREDPDAEGRRVVRGGSFNYYGRHVRCACRFRYLPDFRGDLIGFRVVASHIILSTWAMRIFVHARNARRCGLSGRG